MQRILLIEDDEDFAVIFIRKLCAQYEIHWANSVRMGRSIYKAKSDRFSLVVSDCMGVEMMGTMPDLSFAPADEVIMVSATVVPMRTDYKFVSKQDICDYLLWGNHGS